MRNKRLITQVLAINLPLISIAVIAATLSASPTVSLDAADSINGFIFGLAVSLTVLLNMILLERRMRPLQELTEQMEQVDLAGGPSTSIAEIDTGGTEELERLKTTFDRMLRRLHSERRHASRMALDAQERERERVARDLHDEVNQSLTGLLLRLQAARSRAPDDLAEELTEIRNVANKAMNELLALVHQLRPTTLDDLGLRAALASQVDDLNRQPNYEVTLECHGDVTNLPKEIQLVVYRVAQEALSNAVQHSRASRIDVNLTRDPQRVRLTVVDNGVGFDFAGQDSGLGLNGMLERALLVSGELDVDSRPGKGTSICLDLPIGGRNEGTVS